MLVKLTSWPLRQKCNFLLYVQSNQTAISKGESHIFKHVTLDMSLGYDMACLQKMLVLLCNRGICAKTTSQRLIYCIQLDQKLNSGSGKWEIHGRFRLYCIKDETFLLRYPHSHKISDSTTLPYVPVFCKETFLWGYSHLHTLFTITLPEQMVLLYGASRWHKWQSTD